MQGRERPDGGSGNAYSSKSRGTPLVPGPSMDWAKQGHALIPVGAYKTARPLNTEHILSLCVTRPGINRNAEGNENKRQSPPIRLTKVDENKSARTPPMRISWYFVINLWG